MRLNQAAGVIPAADPLPGNFNFLHPAGNGLLPQAAVGFGNPMTFGPFETWGGRYFNITGAHPHLMDRALPTIKSPPAPRNPGRPVPPRRCPASRSCPTAMSSRHGLGAQAGRIGCRSLAHRARSDLGDEALVFDVNVGMRSTFVDLRNADQNARLKALIPRTDVNVENCCVGTLHRLGFGAEEPASVRPGIIYLSVNAASAAGLLAGPHCAAARRRVAAVMSASV